MGTSEEKVIIMSDWEKRLKDVPKEYMDGWVMNFLVTEGYGNTAHAFQLESETDWDLDLKTRALISLVKDEVEAGLSVATIERIKQIDSEVMEMNPLLVYYLHQQCFIELIEKQELEEALELSWTKLAPFVEKNPEHLEELESLLALLAFEDVANCPIGYLIGKAHRQEIANKAIAAALTNAMKKSKMLRIMRARQGPHER